MPAGPSRRRLETILLWAAPLVWLGCGGDGGGTDIVLPSLTVTTATSGVDLDADGYAIAVDGDAAQPIGLNATMTVDRLSDGQHTVELSGIASNCSAGGANPRNISVQSGNTTSAAFAVTCSASLGGIAVTTSVSGDGSDPDGFGLLLDGVDRGEIGAGATATFQGITPGQHTLGLTGLAANCQLVGENPRNVQVTAGQIAEVAVGITCSAPSPTSGTLEITTATGGSNPDPDGYSVSIDGGSAQAISINATLNLTNVPAGQHSVELLDIAGNCTVSGTSRRQATVAASATARVAFAITCAAPPPEAGSVQVTASTSGASIDPDGYALQVDGGSSQTLTVNGSRTVANLAPGSHTVELGGVAANCTVAGDNPRSVTVSAGLTVPVAFTITCTTPPPGTGSVRITAATSGTSLDPDGYTVSVDGGANKSLSINGSRTVENLTPGVHSVELGGIAATCDAADNPRSVTVIAGQTITISFTITCTTPPPSTGSVQITAATSGSSLDPDGYAVSLDGGANQSLAINGSRTVANLTAGPHSVRLGGVATNCTVAGNNPRSFAVVGGETAAVSFAVTCAATGPSFNLRISNLYITQSTQTLAGTVPLVAGRAAYLRVFVISDQSTAAKPGVQVTLRNGSGTTIRSISAPADATPTAVQEGSLGNSWNLLIEASLIQPGLSISAEVDPDHAIAETNENDNLYPASGTPLGLTVNTAPQAKIRFVPVQQGDQPPGNVTNSNKDQLVELAHRMYPLATVNTDIRAVYSVPAGQLQSDGTGWNQVLSDIESLRIVEGSDRTYFGVARLDYQYGLVGLGFVGLPSALGTDAAADVKRVTAHELGHTWNQLHTPCANPPGIDPDYPYGTGIGVYGFDVTAKSLKPPSTSDIMGYCVDPWISDYIYKRVMTYRAANPAGAQVAASGKEPTLLVWGRIVNGQPVLEPAFQIVTRPRLPDRPGPYSIEGVATDGTSLFSLSFTPAEVADDPSGNRHFAFAVPLDQARAARLADLRLTGPGGVATGTALSVARLPNAATPDSVVARREAGGVALEWNVSAHPMIMVRDPDTGEVLSFARGGKFRLHTNKGSLDLIASDGVRSTSRRVTVTR